MINKSALNIIYKNIVNCNNIETKKTTIVAITKGQPASSISSAYKHGLLNIGESKIQETEKKTIAINKKITTHFIGRLQSNKVRKAIELYDVIQTVHSRKLARRINNICETKNKKQKIYLQVNIGRDANKQGFDPSIIEEEAKIISNMSNLNVSGIMMIPPYRKIDNIYRDYHKRTKELQEKIYQGGVSSFIDISMGMSRDYKLAIKEGATHIRLGSILFGPRNTL